MNTEIRQERPEDYRRTEEVTREAFWNQFMPGCVEHYLLHVMRDSSAFVPELDLVAVEDGTLAGHAAAVKGTIRGDDGRVRQVLTLGPISVLPEYQGRGIGGRLLAAVKERAAEMGFPALLLCGDPAYYSRHGFVPAEQFGIRTADGMYMAALQACELREGALKGAAGRYFEDSVYEISGEEAEAFDRTFPPKEKLTGVKMQKRFEELAAMVREGENSKNN